MSVDSLRKDLDRTGYYPELVADVVESALAGEAVLDHFVHQETTFDSDAVRRHATVLVLTGSRLVVAHIDDHPAEGPAPTEAPDAPAAEAYATASTEALRLSAVRSVVLTHVIPQPGDHRRGAPPTELTLTICWGSQNHVDLQPAACGDPQCEADHGYTGTVTSDDIQLRISSAAEGLDAVQALMGFARRLSAATVPAPAGS